VELSTQQPTTPAPKAAAAPTAGVNVLRPRADDLRVIRIFAGLSFEDLQWIADRCELLVLGAGELVFTPGDPADWMLLLLEGTVQAKRDNVPAGAPTFIARAGDVAGVIPYSRMVSFAGTARAVTQARVARFPKSRFPALLEQIPSLNGAFVSHLIDRVRDATRRDAQFEKLAALGKLSAGLAHELNNPTAAVLRSVNEVRRRLGERGRLTAGLLAAGLSPPAMRTLDALSQRSTPASADRDELARSDREEALTSWLRAHGVSDAWVRAPALVDAGLDGAALEEGLADVPPAAWPTAVEWVEIGLSARALLASAEQGATRVASLVDAMRVFTNMDRPQDATDVDVRAGLESTISLLNGRIAGKAIRLIADFADPIPRIRGFPADLNQAWTSLLENAIDAAPVNGGEIRVHAGVSDGGITVLIGDNGPGIPEDIQSRVWEPFFTTKDVGRGPGLGLDIARRVIVDQHGGQLTMDSHPGSTEFTATLPLTSSGTFGA